MKGLNIGVLAEADKPDEKPKRKTGRRGPYLSLETVLERFRKVHGDRYDYSMVELVTTTEPVIIICSKHGPFEQKPEIHQAGSNCQKCSPPGFQHRQRRKESKAMRVKEER